MKRDYKIPIIAIFVVVALVACVLIFLKKPAGDGYVDVCVSTYDGIALDFGSYKGELTKGTQFFEARLDDVGAFIEDVKMSSFFDEKLYFIETREKNNNRRECFYFVVENRLFSLTVSENHIELSPLETRYHGEGIDYFSEKSPGQFAMVDTYMPEYDDKTDRYLPVRWYQDAATFESLEYLYQKLDDMAKIEDGKIYLKGMADIVDGSPGFKLRPLDKYTFVIYQDENGEIMVSHLY